MPFKPNRKQTGVPDLTELRGILNQTNTSVKNNPLYQFCNSLLNNLEQLLAYFQKLLNDIDNGSDNGSSTNISSLDFVVMSDGATPIPDPVNDGFGNFIYIPYEP